MTPPLSWSSANYEVTPSRPATDRGFPSALSSTSTTIPQQQQQQQQQQSSSTERADMISSSSTKENLSTAADPSSDIEQQQRLLLANGLMGLDALPFEYVFVLDALQLEEEPTLASSDKCNKNSESPSPLNDKALFSSSRAQQREQQFIYLSSPDILDLFGEQEWASLQVACRTLMKNTMPCRGAGRRCVKQSLLVGGATTQTQQYHDMTLFPIVNGAFTAIGGFIQKIEATVLGSDQSTPDAVWPKDDDDKRDAPGPRDESSSECGGSRNSIHGIENKCSSSSCCSTCAGSSTLLSVTMQEAFRESEERHGTLFENMKQGVVYHDGTDGSTIAANASALRILGLSQDQMLGKTPMDPQWRFVRQDSSTLPVEEYPAVVALQGIPVNDMIMGIYKGKEQTDITWIQLDAMPRFRPGEDKPYQAYTIFSDITEAKQMELNLSRAKVAAEEADQLKSAFLATMSHEIRTPLNGILGSLELVLSNQSDSASLGADDLESLHVAMDSGKLLLSIIQDILDLSKIEAGQLDMVCRPFSVQELQETTCKMAHAYQIYCKKEHLELTASIQDDSNILAKELQQINSDQSRLQQLLNNLMTNAIKFTEQGVVSLNIQALYCPDDHTSRLEFRVQDSGKGIPEDRLELIFEPFRQAEFSDTRQYGGTGLGLTVSKKLAHLLGGTLQVESKTGADCHGSCFTFSIPFQPIPSALAELPSLSAPSTTQPEIIHPQLLLRGTEQPPPPPSTRASSSSSSTTTSSSIVVLLVEDDKVSRRIATRMLHKAGYTAVLEAHDGVQAVSLYQQHHEQIDLILMDLMMPNMDGLEATERIRAWERQFNTASDDDDGDGRPSSRYHRVPIVALTAGAMKGDREAALGKGMDSYLTKPVSYKLLVQTVEQCLVEATAWNCTRT